jgi:hypothetical protein
MKITIAFLIFSATNHFCLGQSITNHTISSGYISSSSLSSSMGESSAVRHFLKGSANLTQGYLQVEELAVVKLMDASKKDILLLYPNPAESEINIDLKQQGSGPVEFSLYSNDGRLLSRFVRKVSISSNEIINFQLGEIAKGSYYLHVIYIEIPEKNYYLQFNKK